VKSDELVPVAPDLLKNLFKAMDFPGSEENEYVMKGNTSCKFLCSYRAYCLISVYYIPMYALISSVNLY
jgi:hypothetical protein